MITAKFTFPDLASKLAHAERRISQEMIVAIQTNRGMLFDAEGAYNGHAPWDPLMLRSGQVLANRGVLKKSIAPGGTSGEPGPGGIATMSDGVVTVGTAVAYAGMMNWGTTKMPGGVLRPTHAKALMIPLPAGKKATEAAKELRADGRKGKSGVKFITNKQTGARDAVMFRKWVKIPARRFDTVTQQDREEFAAALQAVITEVMNEVAGG